MSKPLSPFTKQQLLPQEEKLEIFSRKSNLFIGIPKETAFQEKRVCLTPDAVFALVSNGHRVLLESGAGIGAHFSDKEYSDAGAEITNDTAKVYGCPMILKVEPPTLEQIGLINPQTILISAVQLKTQTKKYFETLAAKRVTALAFEFIRDETGAFPAVRSLSEIAGTASVLIAAELLSNVNNGNGLMFGNVCGVPPIEVVILGAGTVGEFATRSALGLGCSVKMFDNSLGKLRRLQTAVGSRIYTSIIQPKVLSKALMRADVVIGAVRSPFGKTPCIVSEEMVSNMKTGAIIIDVSIDQGGCFETSELTNHESPTFDKYGVTHYCVPNIASRVSRTASFAISNIFAPVLIKMGEKGGDKELIKRDHGFRSGVYMYRGTLTSEVLGKIFDLNYKEIELLLMGM